MSYSTIAKMARDGDLHDRFAACVAQENIADNAVGWVSDNAWQLVTAADAVAAYDYATGAGVSNPGARDDVVTDGMILAAVTARAAEVAAE